MIRVWWVEKFGQLPEEMSSLLASRQRRAYLLVRPDLPWEADPLRENSQDRNRLFDLYEALLVEDPMPYRVVSGAGDARLASALESTRALLPGLMPSAE